MLRNIFCILCTLFFIGACGSSEEQIAAQAEAARARNATRQAAIVDGAAVFKQYCVLCHGANGKLGTNGAKDLSLSKLDKAQRIEMIQNGKGLMTPFKEILSDAEIESVADYTFTFKNN